MVEINQADQRHAATPHYVYYELMHALLYPCRVSRQSKWAGPQD